MLIVILDVRLILEGPVLSQSSQAGAYGVDAPMARTADGRYCLPGTLVKGRLRQSWEELSEASGGSFDVKPAEMLGEQTGNTQLRKAGVEPNRGRLHFSDFVCSEQTTDQRLFRIRIDRELGSVSQGAYQVIDAPFAAGQPVSFCGNVRFIARDDTEAERIQRHIELGLRWTTAFGAERTVGFGRLVDVCTARKSPAVSAGVASCLSADDALDLRIRPEKPLCLPLRSTANLFESTAVISGGALKGSLASTWRMLLGLCPSGAIREGMDPDRPELCRYFDRLRFTHAFPAKQGDNRRPIVRPLSIVEVRRADGAGPDAPRWRDLALCAAPGLFGSWAPAFSTDWKEQSAARTQTDSYFGWSQPPRTLRVRTAMDRASRRAKDADLFAYEMVVPEGFAWLARIDLSRVPTADLAAARAQLASLLEHGLFGLGKTKAFAAAEAFPGGSVTPVHASDARPREGVWVVTLQTAALINNPALLDESSGAEELEESYRRAWADLSHGSIALIRYFASHSLAGGFYLHRRFQPGRPYNPYLLTDAGSVFVLQAAPGRESDAKDCMASWLAHGLALPDWAMETYGIVGTPLWMTCPYLPENGCGEICVNLEEHWETKPTPEEYHELQ